MLDDNMAFSKQLCHNHQGGDFCLEGKIKRLKMVAPKVRISNELWRRIARGLDDIGEICERTNRNLDISEQDEYRDVDLYDEIVSWRAVIRCSEMLSHHHKDDAILNIYKEPLSEDVDGFTLNVLDKMQIYADMQAEGQEVNKNSYDYLKVIQEWSDEDSEEDSFANDEED